MKLTAKQEAFVKEYLIDLNATQSAIRAGYSVNRASEIGYQLLQKTTVSEAIQEAIAERSKKTEITAEYVLTSLKEIADRCMQSVPVYDKEGNETGEYTFEHAGANKSLELLGKHLKLFTDRLEHSGETGVKIINDIPRNKD